MPPRSVKMNRFIFGFQRRVWWPKWTPASRRSFMATTGMSRPFLGSVVVRRRGCDGDRAGRPPPISPLAGLRFLALEWYRLAERAQDGGEVGRERRLDVDPLPGERVREREAGGVEELAGQAWVGDAVDGVADDRQADRGEVH